MSDVVEALEILNTTPLSLTANGERVEPFRPLKCRWVDGKVLLNTGGGPRRESAPISIARESGKSHLTVDIPYIRSHFCTDTKQYHQAIRWAAEDRSDPNLRLKVTNNAKSHAFVYLLAPDERDDVRFFTALPGDSLDLYTQNGFFWLFRAPMGEVLGMAEGAKEPPRGFTLAERQMSSWFRIPFDPYTITDGFVEAARAYNNSAQGNIPVKVIGERRKSTPPPDDPLFVSATTVGWDLPTRSLGIQEQPEMFNGLTNRVIRDVQIAGPLLRWNGNNSLLKEYYGRDVADVRNLTVYADHMIVDDNLLFPRTNVTIYARKLTITENGSIHTTPLPCGGAKSEYVTTNAEGETIPADAEGNPTYQGANGRKGEPGGAIRLIVPELVIKNRNCVLAARGGPGQDGEKGGWRPYSRQAPDEPETFMVSPHYTKDDIWEHIKKDDKGNNIAAIDDFVWGRNRAKSLDTATVALGGRDVLIPLADKANTSVVSWEVWLVRGEDALSRTMTDWAERIRSPGGDRAKHSDIKYQRGLLEEYKGRRACSGRGAYPGGRPGDGGDGGTIVSRFRGAKIDPRQVDVGAGRHGNPTAPVSGSPPPGPNPAYHLRLIGFLRRYEISPEVAVEKRYCGKSALFDVSGNSGNPLWGWLVTGDGRDFSSLPKLYREEAGKSKSGECRNDQKDDDLSWMHPAALSATLHYARMCFRNGFREEAATAIHPYYEIATSDRKTKASLECQALLETVVHMRSNLVQNLDYYGNPPGWVPRLDALSNLAALKEIFEATYATYYFADKLLRDYETMEDQRAVSQKMSAALNVESEKAAKLLDIAYKKIPDAMKELMDFRSREEGVKAAIEEVRKVAEAQAIDKAQVQRFFSGMLQLAGGIAKSLPVGQPFLGLGGSALSSASMFDFTDADPFASGKTALESLASSVNTFVTEKTDVVTTAVTAGINRTVGAQESRINQLMTQVANEEKLEGATFTEAEQTWKDFKQDELDKIGQQIKDIQYEIAKTGEGKPKPHEIESANSFLKQLLQQKSVLDDKRLKPLQLQLAEYRKQQFDLLTEAHLLARTKNKALKEVADKSDSSPKLPSVKEKLAAAQAALERKKGKVEARKASAANLMSDLSELGGGLSNVGSAIMSMAKPITPDDPAVKRLTAQILVENSYLSSKGRHLTSTLTALADEKRNKVTRLVGWQTQANSCLNTITANMATLTALSSQRQSLSRALDPAVKSYLQQARHRAEDALGESIYWFVKSYQYECLEDVPDTFYNLDMWAEKIKLFEQEKIRIAGGGSSPNAAMGTGRVILEKTDFESIGRAVFRLEQENLGNQILGVRQRRAPRPEGEYLGCVLQRDQDKKQTEMLDALAQGECVFHFVEDFGKGSFDWNDARVVDVKLVALSITTNNPNLPLTFRVEQVGDMVITKKTSAGRERFIFRHERNDDPIGWQFVYNHKQGEGKITASKFEDGLSNLVKALISEKLVDLKDYKPALVSKYRIRITDLPAKEKNTSLTIRRLVLNVMLSSAAS